MGRQGLAVRLVQQFLPLVGEAADRIPMDLGQPAVQVVAVVMKVVQQVAAHQDKDMLVDLVVMEESIEVAAEAVQVVLEPVGPLVVMVVLE